MSRIARKTAKIFGINAGATQIGQFGSLANASPTYSFDPAVIQGLAEWLSGWYDAVIGGNSPAIQDMNGFCYVMAYQVAYLLSQGVPEYDSGTTYYAGQIVNSGGLCYVSQADTNIGQNLNNGAYWRIIPGDGNIGGPYTSNHTGYVGEVLIKADCTSGPVQITLPATQSGPGVPLNYEVSVKKIDSSSNQLTVAADVNMDGASTQIIYSQWASQRFKWNGLTWDRI